MIRKNKTNPYEYLNVFATNKNNESRAISPHGIRTILSFIGLGASNDLLTKLINLYGNHLNMLDYIKNKSNGLEEYNGVFIRDSLELAPRFKSMVGDHLDINKLSINVNQIIEDKTGFSDVFTDEEISKSCMLLLHTLSFNDTWINQFNPNNTETAVFLKNDNTITDVDMMYQENHLEYYIEDDIKAVKLNFNLGAHAEFIMGLSSNIDMNNIDEFYYSSGKCRLYLPKFTHSETVDLLELFNDAGLEELMVQNNINNLCNDPSLYVDVFKQKIYCSFDEEGATVEAITKLCATRGISFPVTIKFNKPFHYRIVKDDKILISGYYNGD